MPRSFNMLFVLAAVFGAAWFLSQNFEIEGLNQVKLKPKPGRPGDATLASAPPVAPRTGPSIRIASYNIQAFGETKLSKPNVARILAEVVRRFDLVAIQEIRDKDDQFLRRFVQLVNSTGRHYDFVIGPRLGRTSSKEQYAYIFDTASIEVDRSKVYTVPVEARMLHRPPLVGLFRVRGPAEDQAFTFQLVNVHTDPDDVRLEINTLDDVYRYVRDATGLGEDDVIMLGDFNVDERGLEELGEIPGLVAVVNGVPTNIRGTKTYDNLLFQSNATIEYHGRWGVFDVIREFHLAGIDEAKEISDHLPVWAEFSIYENGAPARMASRRGLGTR